MKLFNSSAFHIAVWFAYVLFALWYRLPAQSHSAMRQRIEHGLLGGLLLLHAPLCIVPLALSVPQFGAREALLLLTWLAVAIYWMASFTVQLKGLAAQLLPVAALTIGLALLLPAGHSAPWLAAPLAQLHFAIAMLSYGFLAFAVGVAVLMRLADRGLHQPSQGLLKQLPPLLALERLLFATITLGFILLSCTLATGVLFSEALFGKPMSFSHKTVLSLAAWLVFAFLLWGRWRRGWRGRHAANWTVVGFTLLLLAYVGSYFVRDIVLGR